MSLNASTLATLIKSNLAGITNASQANTILGDTLSSYLLANTVFSLSWVAVQTAPPAGPPPVPDPVTTATGAFTSLSIVISPSGATSASAAQTALQNQIISGVSGAVCNITDIGFATTPISLSSAPTINNLTLTPGGETDGDAAMLAMCTTILDWVKTLVPSAPTNGTRVAGAITYTGTGTIVSTS